MNVFDEVVVSREDEVIRRDHERGAVLDKLPSVRIQMATAGKTKRQL